MTCKTCAQPADRAYETCTDACHIIGAIVETNEGTGTYKITGHWRGYCALEDTRYEGTGIGFKANPRGIVYAGHWERMNALA